MGYVHRDPKVRAEVEQLYVKYRERIFCFARNAINNDYIAEDIVQEVFYEVLQHYELFTKHPNQMGWLYQTAKYKIMELDRKIKQQDALDIDDEEIMIDDVESGYLNSELKQLVKELLSSEEKERYYRYFIWGNTMEEMAELEGVSLNNMRVRITRLRQKLLKEIGLLLVLFIVMQ